MQIRFNSLIAAGAAMLITASLVAMSAPSDSDHKGTKTQKEELAGSIETLQKQLLRRFSERTNVDFGFSRVSRPQSRMHMGPVMGIRATPNGFKYVDGKQMAPDLSGKLREVTQFRPQMSPENPDETTAINAFLAARRDVGIYTYGLFDEKNAAQRLKGPAVLNQFEGPVPAATEIQEFASRAWRSGTANYHEIVNGWGLYATKVSAADITCVQCHTSMQDANGVKPKYAIGDKIGLFVIAVRQPDLPSAGIH